MFRCLPLLLILFTGTSQADEPPIPESPESSIGYATVQEALDGLRSNSQIVERTQDGWIILNDRANNTVWSFTPPEHPAHPSAVRRELTERDGSIYVGMNVLCQADKAPCDQLVRDFKQLNDQMRKAILSGSAK